MTQLDDIQDYLSKTHGITQEEIEAYHTYLEDQEYDTDAVYADFHNFDRNNSNILNISQSPIFKNTLFDYIKQKICLVYI